MLNRRGFLAYTGGAGLALGVSTGLRAQQRAGAGPQRTALVEAARAAAGIPALGVMTVNRRGDTWVQTAGVRSLAGPMRVTDNDLWHLASNTKAMTAVLYARLVDLGRAHWQATMRDLFPDLKVDRSWDAITVEQLLSHGAGIKDAAGTTDAWMSAAWEAKRPQPELRTMLAGRVLGKAAGKGGRFEYANSNYIIVGAAIDRLAGVEWQQAMKTMLFEPLGITHAGFGAPTGDQPRGHSGKAGAYKPVEPGMMADNPPAFGPAGTVHISLRDYAKFLRLFLTDGGGFLKPETLKHLLTPKVTEPIPYAGGWLVLDNSPWTGGRVLQHRGSNSMWQATTFVAPDRGIASVGVVNSGSEEALKAAQDFAIELLKSPA